MSIPEKVQAGIDDMHAFIVNLQAENASLLQQIEVLKLESGVKGADFSYYSKKKLSEIINGRGHIMDKQSDKIKALESQIANHKRFYEALPDTLVPILPDRDERGDCVGFIEGEEIKKQDIARECGLEA